MKVMTDSTLERIIARSNNPGTKTSMFVPLLGTTTTPAQIYRALANVADKLYLEAGKEKPNWPKIDWDHWKDRKAATIALFIFNDEASIFPLMCELQPRVVVADTFHVKPLLMKDTYESETLVLHFNSRGAVLTRVGLYDDEILDRFIPSSRTLLDDWPYRLDRGSVRQFMRFLRDELAARVNERTKFVAISSSEHSVFQVERFWDQIGVPILLTQDRFDRETPVNSIGVARLRLRRVLDRHNMTVVNDVLSNHVFSGGKEQLSTVLKLILDKQITKLVITADDVQFGKIDQLEGLTLHRSQKNHTDDDVFDDLAELALSHGVSVQVVPKRFMPEGYKVIAS